MATNINGDTGIDKIQPGTVEAADIPDSTITSEKLSDSLTFHSVRETQTVKSTSFTPNLTTDGGIFYCTGTMTITMPTATSGKSFTIIHTTGNTITWAGTILWNGGAEPDKGTGIDMYVFYSDGTNWYGMQSGTGFA